MKRTTQHLLVSTLALFTFSGCGNNDPEPQGNTGKVCPDFTATIGVPARAFDQSWEADDEIGISGNSRVNVCYVTTGGDGDFNVKTSGDEIYFLDESEVAFTAYYPWRDFAAGTTTIAADTWMQSQQKSFDFLWARASGKKSAPVVAFTFAHRMAKVVLTVKPGNEVSYAEVKGSTLMLDGFRRNGTFNVADGSTTADDASAAQWKFAGNDNAAHNAPATLDDAGGLMKFTFILFPQKFDTPLSFSAILPDGKTLSAAIDFTPANREKDSADASNEWVAGRQYNLSVTLHKAAIALDNCTIKAWDEVNGGNIDAEN